MVIVTNSLPPYQVHFHRRLAAELPETPLTVITTHRDRERAWRSELPAGVKYIDLSGDQPIPAGAGGNFSLREWRRGGAVIREIRRLVPAAVIVYGYYDLGRVRTLRWCANRGVAAFIWADSNVRGERGKSAFKTGIKKAFIRYVTRGVAGCFACGSLGREYWRRYGVPEERVFIAPYEPDYAQIESIGRAAIEQARSKHGLSGSQRWIVFSGRLVEVKRVDLLIDAFAAIARDRPEWSLAVVGDGPLRASLAARVPGELSNRVRWLGFLDDQREVSSLYRAADVLALPSDYEPWALVVNEAVAAGMAVVATDVVGAAAELVRDGVNGRLVCAGDLGALVDALRDVTAPGAIDRYKAASAGVLAEWRRIGDPIAGVRAAIESGVGGSLTVREDSRRS